MAQNNEIGHYAITPSGCIVSEYLGVYYVVTGVTTLMFGSIGFSIKEIQ
jgi:hypothetical protein